MYRDTCLYVCMYVTGHLYSTFLEPHKGTETVLKGATKDKMSMFLELFAAVNFQWKSSSTKWTVM